MRIFFSFVLLLVLTPCAFSVAAQSQDTVKAILLEHTVELVPKRENGAADFTTISVLLDRKLLKQFAAQNVIFPNVVATFNGLDGDYLVYRTFTGNGACVGGNIYVLKFDTPAQDNNVNVLISPVLSGCLGENPAVSFEYDPKANVIVNIGGDKIQGDLLSRWVRAPRPTPKATRRKTKQR